MIDRPHPLRDAPDPPMPVAGGPVLVASDGAADDGESLFVAARMVARALGGDVEVVGVSEPLPALGVGALLPAPSPELEQRRRDALHADMARALAVAASGDPAWAVTTLSGPVAHTLAAHAEARHAALLVMGLGRHSPLDRLFGRETAVDTLREATVPVLAVGQAFPRHLAHAVVGVDFSPACERAAALALRLLPPGGRLSLVHVSPRFARPVEGWAQWDAEYAGTLPRLFEGMVSRLHAPAETTVETVVLRGDPAPTLLAWVQRERAPLLAVGARQLGAVDRMVVGSVAARLLRTARCGVAVVPGRMGVDSG